jgi:rubredoxin-NAD+ reductase
MSVVIIGAGLAGLGVARELRALRPDLAVTVVTADDGHQYPKPQLSTSLRTGKQPDELVTRRAEAFVADGITLVTRSPVTRIDTAKHQVELADGSRLDYEDLVIATGARPFVPPLEGDADKVLTVNHLDDYRRFRAQLVPDAPVLVVGGGLIGIEFTADLLSQGHPVSVVDPGAGPLPRLLPPGAASLLSAALARAGARFYWERTLGRLEGRHATLSDGTQLEVATVLSAVGLRPEVGLAQAAGLPVGRSIRVDGFLRAAPNIYALGDCAELPGGVYLPFIKPIGEQARYVARAIAGQADEPFRPTNYAIAVKVPQWATGSTTPLPVEAGSWDEQVADDGSLSLLHTPQGKLLRVVATGARHAELRDWLPRVPALG